MKNAGSLLGFKHSEESIKRMSIRRLGKYVSEATKLKIAASSDKACSLRVTNINTGDVKIFTSIRSTAKFMDMHYSYLSKCIKVKNLYVGKGYRIVLNN